MHDIDVIADIVVIVGFWLLPLAWWRFVPLTPHVLTSGLVLFVTSGFSRMADLMGAGKLHLTIANHVAQAISIVWFLVSFWKLMRRAHQIRCEVEARYERQGEVPER